MQIHARRVGVTGPNGPLLKPTSLLVKPGELVIVAGEPGTGHTALGLVLSGRMRPTTGEVSPSAAELRGHVVLVDSPDVNEPEGSLTLAGVVGEELAMNGARGGRKAVADWLVGRGADEYLDHRFEQVPAGTRCALMLELAAGRPGATTLVLDSPDRYHGDPKGWWELARGHVTPDRSVVALCTTLSAATLSAATLSAATLSAATLSAGVLDVPVARIGADNVPEESE